MLHRSQQAFVPVHLRLPAKQLASPADVRPAHLRIILRKRLVFDLALAAGQLQNLLRELSNGDLVWIAEIDRLVEIGVQQPKDAFDEIGDIAKAAGLRAIAVDRERLAPARLP